MNAPMPLPSQHFNVPGIPGSPPRSGAQKGIAATTGISGRILIVEDEYFVALSTEASLGDAGYDVIGVESTGEAALARAISEKPDLILMDIRLAGKMDGIDAALALLPHGLRVVFASAHSDAVTRGRGNAAQPLGWLFKPFSGDELVLAVARALERRRPT
ncbi:response regulator [Polymorphobacter multimanifer]|uniref:DNA-binding NarL/FixJ family response regulator n=1 Tax=Polymorphobacter multimanifer TaxID=1070431 RepID=A0A841L419_9SPHN|nr:response regulator [Polymorphobacter multimanifer]MBB6227384.1 DNA-binding NarL/FixJ family response regulator [Polymorphobacter multimanifer]